MCWFFCTTLCFRPSITLFLLTLTLCQSRSESSLGHCLMIWPFSLLLLWSASLSLSQTLAMSSWHCGSQHDYISCIAKNCNNQAHQWEDEAHVDLKSLSVWLDGQLGSNGSIAPQISAASAHIARSGDVSGQNRTESKQKWIKPMSETLSGLWIRSRRRLYVYSFGPRRGGFFLPTAWYKFMAHCEFIFICISLGKMGSWASGK